MDSERGGGAQLTIPPYHQKRRTSLELHRGWYNSSAIPVSCPSYLGPSRGERNFKRNHMCVWGGGGTTNCVHVDV